MQDFQIEPTGGFTSAFAIDRMLQLLLTVIEEIVTHKDDILLFPLSAVPGDAETDPLIRASEIARVDIEELLSLQRTVDFSLSEKEHLRMSGPVFYLRMTAIKAAREQAMTYGPDGLKQWSSYRAATLQLLDLIQLPLQVLTQSVDGPRGAIEFMSTLKTLMEMKTLSAA